MINSILFKQIGVVVGIVLVSFGLFFAGYFFALNQRASYDADHYMKDRIAESVWNIMDLKKINQGQIEELKKNKESELTSDLILFDFLIGEGRDDKESTLRKSLTYLTKYIKENPYFEEEMNEEIRTKISGIVNKYGTKN